MKLLIVFLSLMLMENSMANIDKLLRIFAKESGQSEKTARQIAREESNFGKAKGYEGIGGTQGVFHITKKAAMDIATEEEKKVLRGKSKKQFAQHMAANPELDAKLAGRHTKSLANRMSNKGVVLENLTDEEKASVLSNLYNYGRQKNLINKTAELSQKRFVLSREATQDLKKEVTDQMDIVKAGGKVMPGLVKRRNREKELFMKEEPMAKEKKKKEEKPSLLGPLRQEEPKAADNEIAMVMQDVVPKDDPVAAQTMRNNLLVKGDQEETTSGNPISPAKVLEETVGAKIDKEKEEAERKPASIEDRQEKENKRFQLSQSMKDALSYFGPRMGALLLGGVNAMEITDDIMTGFESQQRGRTRDRQRAQQLEQQDQMTPFQQEQLRLRQESLDLRRQALDPSQAAEQEAVKLTEKQQDTLDKIDDTLGSMSTARQFLKKGNLTGFFDNYVQGAFDAAAGDPRAYGRKVLEKLRVDDALIRIGQTKGAISDKEMGLFLSPAPTLNSQEGVWLKWIDEREAAAKKIRERIKTGKRAENPATDEQVKQFSGDSSQEEKDNALINKYL